MNGSVFPEQVEGEASTAVGGETLQYMDSTGDEPSRISDAVFDTIAPARGVAEQREAYKLKREEAERIRQEHIEKQR